MIDPKVIELADRMIRVQFEERKEQLQRDIAVAQSEAAMRGMATSSPMVQKAHELCARDIELRALIVWQNLVRVLSSSGVLPSESLAEDLKQAVLKHMDAIYSYPYECLQRVVRNVGIGTASLTEARDRAMAKVNTEIDLFALSLIRRAETKEQQPGSPQPVFNIYSSVGAIQTGPSATANVVMNLSSQEREALIEALELVKKGLSIVENLPGHPKEEVLDLVEEARTEASRPKPNGMRLGSVLSAVATAIQTAGALQPAYQALKAALLPLGIPLP